MEWVAETTATCSLVVLEPGDHLKDTFKDPNPK